MLCVWCVPIMVVTPFLGSLEKLEGFNILPLSASGDDVLKQLAAADKLPDVCVINAVPGKVNGYHILQKLQKHYPALKTLVFTRISHPLALLLCIGFGSMGYISYDCHAENISSAIVQVSQGQTAYQADIHKQAIKMAEKKKRRRNEFLSPAEFSVMELSTSCMCIKQIAHKLNKSPGTIQTQFKSICAKLDIAGKEQMLKLAIEIGL